MNRDRDKDKAGNANRDPLSGAPGAHPVGTGVGAAAGGAAAGAAVGSVAGPVGTAAGIVAGAIVGGLAGKGAAEAINPTVEDAYWRERHAGQWYAKNRSYDDYQGAYRTGYEGYSKHWRTGRSFEDAESDLRQDYERNKGKSILAWDEAKHAARAAWQKVSGNHERLIGCAVHDETGRKIGDVHNLWADETGQLSFIGVKTGWIFGKNHVVPVHTSQVNERQRIIRLPFSEEKIKNAPTFDADRDLSDSAENEIYRYYGVTRSEYKRQFIQPLPAGTMQTTAPQGEDIYTPLRRTDAESDATKPRFGATQEDRLTTGRYEPKERGKNR